jgi:mannose-6-phosphate isomerase-like protein (cupin superfamily)
LEGRARVIRDRELEPSWDLKRATEPGFVRSLTTWLGGPEGYINSHLGKSVISDRCAVGLMRMPIGNRQPGVHVHSVTEIYVILKGEVESFDGVGRAHRAGPLDCLYIPAGVPHGVRAVGDHDLELIWLHDGIEKLGVSTYLEGDGPFPASEEVSLISFRHLQPNRSNPRTQEAGFVRWSANWVGGPEGHLNYNRGDAALNDRIGVGLTVILPGSQHVPHSHPDAEIYVLLRGRGVTRIEGELLELGPLDAIYYPAGKVHALKNPGEDPLYVMWVHEAPQRLGTAAYAV